MNNILTIVIGLFASQMAMAATSEMINCQPRLGKVPATYEFEGSPVAFTDDQRINVLRTGDFVKSYTQDEVVMTSGAKLSVVRKGGLITGYTMKSGDLEHQGTFSHVGKGCMPERELTISKGVKTVNFDRTLCNKVLRPFTEKGKDFLKQCRDEFNKAAFAMEQFDKENAANGFQPLATENALGVIRFVGACHDRIDGFETSFAEEKKFPKTSNTNRSGRDR